MKRLLVSGSSLHPPAVVELHGRVLQQLVAVEQQRHALDVHVAALRVRRQHAGDGAVRDVLGPICAIQVQRGQRVAGRVRGGLLGGVRQGAGRRLARHLQQGRGMAVTETTDELSRSQTRAEVCEFQQSETQRACTLFTQAQELRMRSSVIPGAVLKL